jgi:N-acetylneuraminate synthase/N,N'-diacetyllegionaminate synthase
MKIGKIDTNQKVFVVAEIGNNHEGDFELARRLISEAAACGADAVKFQTIVPERLVDRSDGARIEQLRQFQFSREQFEKLKQRADDEGILFLSTPFDLESAAWLNDLVPAFKVASGDNTFWPLLDFLTSTGKPLLLSTGLILHDDLLWLREFLRQGWKKHQVTFPGLALLHCIVNYPTSDGDANLLRIRNLAGMDSVTPGYSDHTLGIEAAILSVALGARVVEKHFTFDKNRDSFRDHQLSADPADLKALVSGIRKAELLLGSAEWDARGCELQIGPRVRRSIAAKRDLSAGDQLTPSDLIWVRPGSGWAPGRESELVGRSLRHSVLAGEIFTSKHFAPSCAE